MVTNPQGLIDNRVAAIRYHQKAGIPKAELDISGGIDSAVMACLLSLAIGPENIILVHSRFSTAKDQTNRADQLARALGIPMNDFQGKRTWDALLDGMRDAIIKAHGHDVWEEAQARMAADPTILGSIRSCLRAPIGRGFNRILGGGIRHGTGNECEDRWLRFYQKGGDGEVDSNPIAMLSKTEVYQLAAALGHRFKGQVQEILADTARAVPSADLWANGNGHTDEAEIQSWLGVPFTYGRVDPDTGEILHFGTIERVSRFLDGGYCSPEYLFQDDDPPAWGWAVGQAEDYFKGFSDPEIEAFLRAARRAEQATRHKWNPNIPTLGTRIELRMEGILSERLD